ncbi:MAG: TetR/AcrR family transcriptional regulator [Acidimicrobiia bacterium]|nr:TetR/AcrR family transcriptional regulator [Acidimicrobiia bacterium]
MTRKRLTRDEARLRTRNDILVAARQLFGRNGYRGASLEEIAENAGYSKGAVYSNWPSKEALFLELLDAEMEAGEGQHANTDLSPTTWALATLEFFVDAVNSPGMRSALADRYESARSAYAQQIAQGRPDLDWASWNEIASIVMAAGSGLIIQNAIDPKALDPNLLHRTISQLIDHTDVS